MRYFSAVIICLTIGLVWSLSKPAQALGAITGDFSFSHLSMTHQSLNGLIENLPALEPSEDSLKVQALLAEGDVFYRRLDNQLAIQTYRKAFLVDSTSFPVLSRLSRTATDLGNDFSAADQKSAAEELFLEAVTYAEGLQRHHSDSAKTHFYLALSKGSLALFIGGRRKVSFSREIEAHCKRGLAIDPTDAQLLVVYGLFNREVASSSWMERTLAQALFGQIPEGTKENAVSLLSRAVEEDPDLHVARFELSLSLIAVGRPEEAIVHLKQAEALPAQTTQDNRNRQLAKRMLERIP
ncbi:MAG: tetratricopeptide repeat protein [Rhodothermales bacterium]